MVDARVVQTHLDATAVTVDTAAALATTPFEHSADITAAARSIAVRRSQLLAYRTDDREAVSWFVATLGRCKNVLAADAPSAVAASAGGRFTAAASTCWACSS